MLGTDALVMPVEQLVRGGPLLRVFDQGGFDQGQQRIRHCGDVGLGVQDPVHDGFGRSGAERRLAAGRVPHGHAPDKNVSCWAWPSGVLLRCHEARRADHHSGIVVEVGASRVWAIPKSMTFGPLWVEDDVGGLEVPVHDPGGMYAICQRLRQAGRQAVRRSRGPSVPCWSMYSASDGPSAYSVTMKAGADSVSASITRTVHTPLTRGQHGHLAAEPTAEVRVIGQFGAEQLHGDQAAVLGYTQVHHTPMPPAPTRAVSR